MLPTTFRNTIEDRFTKGTALKFSSRWDAIEAVCVADIDLDGQVEIIVGTFGCVSQQFSKGLCIRSARHVAEE